MLNQLITTYGKFYSISRMMNDEKEEKIADVTSNTESGWFFAFGCNTRETKLLV